MRLNSHLGAVAFAATLRIIGVRRVVHLVDTCTSIRRSMHGRPAALSERVGITTRTIDQAADSILALMIEDATIESTDFTIARLPQSLLTIAV